MTAIQKRVDATQVADEGTSPAAAIYIVVYELRFGITISSTTAPSSQDSSIAAGAPFTFSDHFKLLNQRTLYVDSSGDVELVVIHDDESRTFCVSSHAMRHAISACRAMLDSANEFNEAFFVEKSVKLHNDDFEALFIVFLAAYMKLLDVSGKVEFAPLIGICVVVDKYDCIGVLSLWLPIWVYQWSAESHVREHWPQWSFIAWVTRNEETFKCTTWSRVIGLDDSRTPAKYTDDVLNDNR